jgi:hypothetical protein
MLRKNFHRADGFDFELIRSGNKTLLWKVEKEGKVIRFETWIVSRCASGQEDYEENQIKIFFTLESAERWFEEIERNF